MKLHRCSCEWSWVIGKRKVFGPMYVGANPRMMTRKEFRRGYGDCEPTYMRRPHK